MLTDNDITTLLVQFAESCELEAYPDTGGIWTCGWGQTGPDVVRGTVWTQAYADRRLRTAIEKALLDAVDLSPCLLDENPNKRAAIADFIYNLGPTAYRNSTLRQNINKKYWGIATNNIKQWCYGRVKKGGTTQKVVLGGLVKRRGIEAGLLLSDDNNIIFKLIEEAKNA